MLDGIAGSYEGEAKCPEQKLVRTLKSIRPSPQYTVSFPGFVRRWADAAQFIHGLSIANTLRLFSKAP
jgi:hypothetical protein